MFFPVHFISISRKPTHKTDYKFVTILCLWCSNEPQLLHLNKTAHLEEKEDGVNCRLFLWYLDVFCSVQLDGWAENHRLMHQVLRRTSTAVTLCILLPEHETPAAAAAAWMSTDPPTPTPTLHHHHPFIFLLSFYVFVLEPNPAFGNFLWKKVRKTLQKQDVYNSGTG